MRLPKKGIPVKLDRKRLKLRYAKIQEFFLVLFTVLINGGFFPIVDFDPYSQVHRGIVMRMAIFLGAFAYHKNLGKKEAAFLPEVHPVKMALKNILMIALGLGISYISNWGQVANAYNFTMQNTIFHVVVLLSVTMVSYFMEWKKQDEEDEGWIEVE